MPEFDELRTQLAQAREAGDAAAAELAKARETVRRLELEHAQHERTLATDDPERERLRAHREEAEADAAQAKATYERHVNAEDGLVHAFEPFSDPRDNVGRLEDAFPVLLFPVRLETRFKTVGDEQQLWVRVYPDTCLIDTFEATLATTEVRNAQAYWQGIWRAGGFEEDERAAWRNLVASHGSGRAMWIVEHYVPANPNDRPAKVAREDVVLVLAREGPPLPAPQETALETYWKEFWLADGDFADEEAALVTLRNAVGAARADELIETYRPFNVTDEPLSGAARSDVSLSVAWVEFPPDVETKVDSWTQAPRVRVLPDRFVLIARSGEDEIVEVGEPVHSPLIAGPDPSAPADEQLRKDGDDLAVPDELLWLTDFERAVEWGLGFKIMLDAVQARRGFDRLLVLGVRISADAATGQGLLEELLRHHHYGRSGFSLLPQGTPTNNTEGDGSGFTRIDDPDASFDALAEAPGAITSDWLRKRDGQWLAELLGVDSMVLERVQNANATDQSEARALQAALWPATLGYFMETMMRPTFADETVEQTATFFRRYVSGRGFVPTIRIGAQPYGILPTTAFSRINWIDRERGGSFFGRLFALMKLVDADWQQMAARVDSVANASDAHAALLSLLGLHPASVEFHYRYARSARHVYNHLNFLGIGGEFWDIVREESFDADARALLARLGAGEVEPELLERYFHRGQGRLTGDVIDDRPLSETEEIRDWTDDDRNYIEWLIDAARSSLDALRLQAGFTDDKPPTALLYLLLRHALMLGYADAAYELYRAAEVLPEDELAVMKQEPPFVHVAAAERSESRWAPLYAQVSEITGSEAVSVADFATEQLDVAAETARLRDQIEALELLAHVPTARLERVLAEHLDCCAYRFDAWLLGLVHLQLAAMRLQRRGEEETAQRGVYLGAYAWLEDVRPEGKALTPVRLSAELDRVFNREQDPPLLRDPTNGGYLHAPSLNQAVTAAVLRSGYLANASSSNPRSLAVNLSSERVRLALLTLDGIRAGHSLGALLGYRFERGLHDRHNLAEVDRFIFPLRKAFPLRADHLASTQTGDDVSIEAIEARNVVDGLRLVEHVRENGNASYPFGLTTLPSAGSTERQAIDAEVDRLLDVHDAVADLALAEGVHQAVQGNYDRVAGTLDAYTRGSFPPEPDVVRTPTTGFALTHRVGLHLDRDATAPAGATPRATAEPPLNAWLTDVLPELDTIACTVVWEHPVTGAPGEEVVTMDDLGLQAFDLLYLVGSDTERAMTELDDRVIAYALGAGVVPRPDTVLEIRYLERPPNAVSVFEVAPLVRQLRSLILRARPLRPGDVALQSGTKKAADERVFTRRTRVADVKDDLDALLPDLNAYALPANPDDILDTIDQLVDDAAALLARAAAFGIPETGWGYALEWRRAEYAGLVQALRDRIRRWDERLATFDQLLDEYDDDLDPATPPEERLILLRRIESFVTTVPTPPPVTPASLRGALTGLKNALIARQTQLRNVADGAAASLADLLDDVAGVLPLDQLDPEPFTLDAVEARVVAFAEELAASIAALATEVDRRSKAAKAQLDAHDAAAPGPARVEALQLAAQAMLGDDFRLVPEFGLTPAQADEWQNALDASTAGELTRFLIDEAGVDFPVDEWLYGTARLRDQMHALEQITLLAEGFARTDPELIPIQLPYRPDDSWLALEFPDDYTLDGDRVLYTAHYTTPFAKSERQCGLLLDEWTEVIPGDEELTGIAFNFDRPSSEAPQSLLLVTPATWDGKWQWNDLVAALDETLELAKKRAVEPAHVDETAYSRFLPATVLAATLYGISIATPLAVNNGALDVIQVAPDG